VHGANGIWATANGYEYNLTILVTSLGLALIGAGQYSIDALLF
jgi:putative oxidoreductase